MVQRPDTLQIVIVAGEKPLHLLPLCQNSYPQAARYKLKIARDTNNRRYLRK
jgi:hypothetical protein